MTVLREFNENFAFKKLHLPARVLNRLMKCKFAHFHRRASLKTTSSCRFLNGSPICNF